MQELSDALLTLVKSQTMKYIKVEIVKRTVFASLMSSLAPIAWLKIGQIIGKVKDIRRSDYCTHFETSVYRQSIG